MNQHGCLIPCCFIDLLYPDLHTSNLICLKPGLALHKRTYCWIRIIVTLLLYLSENLSLTLFLYSLSGSNFTFLGDSNYHYERFIRIKIYKQFQIYKNKYPKPPFELFDEAPEPFLDLYLFLNSISYFSNFISYVFNSYTLI